MAIKYLKIVCSMLFIVLVTSFSLCNSQAPLILLNVLFGNAEKSSLQISPNGKQLAYCAPLDGVFNIWVKTVGKDDDHAITHETSR